jgi:hypothetical protein
MTQMLSTALRKIVVFLNAEGRRGSAEERRVFLRIIRYELMKYCTKRTIYQCLSVSTPLIPPYKSLRDRAKCRSQTISLLVKHFPPSYVVYGVSVGNCSI